MRVTLTHRAARFAIAALRRLRYGKFPESRKPDDPARGRAGFPGHGGGMVDRRLLVHLCLLVSWFRCSVLSEAVAPRKSRFDQAGFQKHRLEGANHEELKLENRTEREIPPSFL